jgi:hypothetical protein
LKHLYVRPDGGHKRNGEARGLLALIAVLAASLGCTTCILAALPDALDAAACVMHGQEHVCQRVG